MRLNLLKLCMVRIYEIHVFQCLCVFSLTHTHNMHIHALTRKPFSFTTPSLFVHLWEEIETGTRKTALLAV